MKVGLETIVSELPETIVTDDDQAYLKPVIHDWMRAWFRFPKEVRRLKDDQAFEILSERVARKALDTAKLGISDIDCIISNNSGGRYCLPAGASFIHQALGFEKEKWALNIGNTDASFIDACELAWNLISAEKFRRILVVMTSAWETSGGQGRIDLSDPMSGLMGDGAAAAIVSTENLKCEFLSYYTRTLSEVYDWRFAILRPPANQNLKGASDQPSLANYLTTRREYIEWWQRRGQSLAVENFEKALKRAVLPLSALDTVIYHQPLDTVYDVWIDGAEKAGLSRGKWKSTWDKYGDLMSAVIPVNLAEFWSKGELKANSVIGLITVATGGHMPTIILKWLT